MNGKFPLVNSAMQRPLQYIRDRTCSMLIIIHIIFEHTPLLTSLAHFRSCRRSHWGTVTVWCRCGTVYLANLLNHGVHTMARSAKSCPSPHKYVSLPHTTVLSCCGIDLKLSTSTTLQNTFPNRLKCSKDTATLCWAVTYSAVTC